MSEKNGYPTSKDKDLAVSDTATAAIAAANQFLDFANETGSPYHTVSASMDLFKKNGFQKLLDGETWKLEPGGKYYVTKGGSDIMAFAVGKQFSADKGGLTMFGAHTDSPCLRVRPVSKMSSAGMIQVGIQTYGGGLWHTWFDRPLGCAGKVIVRDSASGQLCEKLVRIVKPIMIIPNLAIHLTSADERKAFAVNTESHLQPIICSKARDDQCRSEAKDGAPQGILARHHAVLLEALAQEADCKVEDIVDLDICLMDAFPGNLCGVYHEFVSVGRIDNVLSTWGGAQGLCEWATADAISKAEDICLMASLDHEECGSLSAMGADSNTLPVWIKRILAGLGVNEIKGAEVITRSFLVSCDCAHAVHPNYAAKHQSEHKPEMQKGMVIKTNANQRYATSALTSSIFREICHKGGIPVQDFVVRNDCPCGTTIGPIISSLLTMRTIDIGPPQWAMHSCRETCGVDDCKHTKDLVLALFSSFRALEKGINPV
eukprot:gnl/MRDRNA2_/MRDRNA2_27444_c1_seq1.p1 gnl/MRDRNA2_/MRDRNA2_27444_c1~~gnl/MRDRNA2_/MRDRNA2_27444_c1_seq1.p1  ORF type:complete len:488 (-),score=76.41 gnl/MRDRNA2_/MRDRNA2_27444_c1_seq1:60-1523(-)